MSRDGMRGQAVRFLVVGGTNTLVTYGIFVLLGLYIPVWVAYTIAFALGMAWVTVGSSRFVFKSSRSVKRVAWFCAWYLLVYAAGRIVVHVLAPVSFVDLTITSVVVVVVTTPLSFLGGRFIFSSEERGA